jgi:hypothetical protein
VADVVLEFGGKRHPLAPLFFAPNEMKVLSITDLLASINQTAASVPAGGITITPRGSGSTLAAAGMMADAAAVSSAPLHFLSPDRQLASALHANGLPMGTPSADSPYSATSNFAPHVVLRNLIADSQTVTLTLEFPSAKGTQQLALPPVSLEGFTTQDIALDSLLGQSILPTPYGSLRIQYSGAAGSVVGEVFSIEQNGALMAGGALVNEGDGRAGGGAASWHVDASTQSILFLTNMGERDARIGFKVQAQGVSYYLTNLKLKPHETRSIDVRQLRDAQQADFRKTKIPLSASDGRVSWMRLDNVPVMGRLIILNPSQNTLEAVAKRATSSGRPNGGGLGSVRPFLITPEIYGDCPCPSDYSEIYVPRPMCWMMMYGDTCQWATNGEWVDCNSGDYYYDITFDSTWSSSNTSVATVDSAGKVTAAGPGSATLGGFYADFMYSGPRCTTDLIGRHEDGGVSVVQPRASIPNPPVSGDGDATISGQSFILQIEAIDPSTGQRATGFNGSVYVAFPVSSLIQGESVSPNPVSLSQGVGQTQVTLKVVDSSPGYSCCRTYTLNSSLVTQSVGYINVWFNVGATVEFYRNCDGNLSYGAHTACNSNGLPANSVFVALPSSVPCGTTLKVNNNGTLSSAPWRDLGPETTSDSYWTTSGTPQYQGRAIDISDGFANLLGASSGCNGTTPYTTLGSVLWRFN